MVLFALVFALLSVGVYAQQPLAATAPPEIVAPPGGALITEVNLSDNDVLGMLKQAIDAFAQSSKGAKGEIGQGLKAVDLSTLAEAIQGVSAIRAMQFKLTPGTSAGAVLNFYQTQLPTTQGWSRILFDTSMAPKGAMAVYTRGGQEYFSIGIDPSKNRAYVARTIGSVDVPKFASWLGGVAKFASTMEAKYKPPTKAPVTPKAKAPTKAPRKR
jgi:hypothetical protein